MVTKLALQNFRSFTESVFSFSNQTVFVGENGVGKTNVLEALTLLSTGKSMRTTKSEEIIHQGKEVARIKAKIVSDEETEVFEVVLTKGFLEEGGLPKNTPRKRLLIDNTPKRSVDYAGKFKTVLFQPQDMELINASPSIRRAFLDTVLTQTDRQYRRALLSYEKGLRQRNKLLWKLRELGGSRTTLYFWDKLLIKEGNYISDKRYEFITFLNEHAEFGGNIYKAQYDKSAISESRLKQYEREEVQAGVTLVGPHRDDMLFYSEDKEFEEGKDLSHYGSRGEQRMGVLWAKLNELEYIAHTTGDRPTLLLDDIFSELDHKHRQLVYEASLKQQTIFTTADPHYITEFSGIDKIQL